MEHLSCVEDFIDMLPLSPPLARYYSAGEYTLELSMKIQEVVIAQLEYEKVMGNSLYAVPDENNYMVMKSDGTNYITDII